MLGLFAYVWFISFGVLQTVDMLAQPFSPFREIEGPANFFANVVSGLFTAIAFVVLTWLGAP